LKLSGFFLTAISIRSAFAFFDRLKIEYLRSAFGGSILVVLIRMMERSDTKNIQYSIYNIQ